MQTHDDWDSPDMQEAKRRFLEQLKADAESMVLEKRSEITAGSPGEPVLNRWTARGVEVRQLPPDKHGILRISIGGGEDTPVEVNYCVFRGDREKCAALLKKALRALQRGVSE